MIATPVGELLLDRVDEATTRTIACFVAELRETQNERDQAVALLGVLTSAMGRESKDLAELLAHAAELIKPIEQAMRDGCDDAARDAEREARKLFEHAAEMQCRIARAAWRVWVADG